MTAKSSNCSIRPIRDACQPATIHDGPGDADNPHTHIIFRNRDAETGRRVTMTSEPGE